MNWFKFHSRGMITIFLSHGEVPQGLKGRVLRTCFSENKNPYIILPSYYVQH